MRKQKPRKKQKKKHGQKTRVCLSSQTRRYFQQIATSLSLPLGAVLESYLQLAATEKYSATLLWNKHRPEIHNKLLAAAEERVCPSTQSYEDGDKEQVPIIDIAKLCR